ncbi:ZIP family metal transporter [Microvirga sp. Marseille-Q2068]|uniref:ZIP family metal transporter n=2 Tax=Microvirga mediterraneensis TaxID=2754695 RepID=A0A838BVE2_9HYPH|nr:ZIP family metal transporter [Microvirga mediterraneensis]MBA1159318.1 ZIP family metal transporter [Microvirga mediterraneensis]
MMASNVLIAVGASAAAGAATGLGALPLLLVKRISPRTEDAMLGFAAGVMTAAAFFSLLLPGLDAARAQIEGQVAPVASVAAALLAGAVVIGLIEWYAPHEHFIHGRQGRSTADLKRVWLFVIAITLHNVPEGLAVGVGFGGNDMAQAASLAIAIRTQNLPEGLAVAGSLLTLGYSRLASVALALGTGLVEPLGGLLGVTAVTFAGPILPWGMGFSAGAMLFVISHEIIPETHRRGHERLATGGFMLGLPTMMILDVAFA